MPRDDELERYENTEARHIIQLLKAVQPPQVVQVPPDFRAKVMARIEQRRRRHGFLAWPIPAWGLALAVGLLLLSIGANVWLGLRVLWQPEPGGRQIARSVPERIGRDWPFDVSTFQARIQSHTALGTLVTAHSLLGKQAVAFGFAPKPVRVRFFIMGVLYADALAYLHSGERDAAAQRLAAIEIALDDVQAPVSLSAYLSKIRHLLESPKGSAEVMWQALALSEPFFADYAGHTGMESLPLFRVGIWLESTLLAAVAGDTAALQQGEIIVQYFQREMDRLPAPKGVLDALEQLRHLLAKPEMTDRDVKEVLKLVKTLHLLLGS